MMDSSIKCLCATHIDDGFTIQCEKCLFWSHAVCYKIAPRAVPENFFCMTCSNTDTENDVVDEESFINWGQRIVQEYFYGYHIGDKAIEHYYPLENCNYLIFPRNKLKKAPILGFMRFKAYDKVGNDLYLTMPGQYSFQKQTFSDKHYPTHTKVADISSDFVECFHSLDEIKPAGLSFFAPTTLTFGSKGLDMLSNNLFYRKGCQGNISVQKTEDNKYYLSSIDEIKEKDELILQYSDLELDYLTNWSFQEFLSGCNPQPKSCIMLSCASCKLSDFKHCILYHKLLRNTKLEVVPVRGDQPSLSISPVDTNVKRKRGRPPKKKTVGTEEVKKKKSPKIIATSYSRKSSAANSPRLAPKLNPASITPSQVSEAEVDDLITQIQVFEEPISDLTYIQIGNGMVVKRARLKTVNRMPEDWKGKHVESPFLKKMDILKRYRESQTSTVPKKILKITDFIK